MTSNNDYDFKDGWYISHEPSDIFGYAAFYLDFTLSKKSAKVVDFAYINPDTYEYLPNLGIYNSYSVFNNKARRIKTKYFQRMYGKIERKVLPMVKFGDYYRDLILVRNDPNNTHQQGYATFRPYIEKNLLDYDNTDVVNLLKSPHKLLTENHTMVEHPQFNTE